MISPIRPVNLDKVLNVQFPNLPMDVKIPLKHFNNKRHVFITKGKNYIIKTTKKVDDKNPLTLIRTLINVGTPKRADLRTKQFHLRTNKADVFVYIDRYAAGVDQDGIHLEVTNRRGGYLPYQRPYGSFMEMRQDKHFQSILEDITGKDLFRKD